MINNTKRLFMYFVAVSGYKGITKNQLKKITKTITPRKIRGFIILAFAKQASYCLMDYIPPSPLRELPEPELLPRPESPPSESEPIPLPLWPP